MVIAMGFLSYTNSLEPNRVNLLTESVPLRRAQPRSEGRSSVVLTTCYTFRVHVNAGPLFTH